VSFTGLKIEGLGGARLYSMTDLHVLFELVKLATEGQTVRCASLEPTNGQHLMIVNRSTDSEYD
jgi:hypothetical protein